MKFKKFAFVICSILILGALVSVAATTTYPLPFVKNGEADVAIVYGANSAVSDLTAANKISNNLKSVFDSFDWETSGNFSSDFGITEDEVFLEDSFENIYSDREVETLFDGKVEFDGEDYDAEETFNLDGLVLKANENDFEGIPYLTIPEDVIEFKLVFENDLKTSEIGGDNGTLTFNLFGEEVKVSSWDVDEITFTKGTEYFLSEGDSVTVDGKVIVLNMVLEDAIYVLVDGVGGKIVESNTKTINGIEIKVKEVLYTGKESQVSKATLMIGEEIETTIKSGNEYEEDSIWDWIIDEHSIGLILVEDFTELDEDFNALAVGERICLPNNYVCVLFDGMIEEDSEEYTFELDTKSGFGYVEVNGNFQVGIDDYDRIYINLTGIYDRDFVLIEEEVKLGDTEMKLELGEMLFNGTKFIRIGNDEFINEFIVTTNLQFANANKNQDNLADWECNGKDENWLTNYGILIENPEDSCEDNYFKIIVPEERLEATISILGQGKAVIDDTVPQFGVVVVKDTEIASVATKNLIVVGGSCINSVAAKLLGVPVNTCGTAFTQATGIGAGQYIIEQYTSPYNSEKVAVLVAGYNAADTTLSVDTLLA